LLVVLALAVLLIFCGYLLPQWYLRHYDGRVLPGVKLAGVDLGGRSPEDARAALLEALTVYQGELELYDEGDPMNVDDQRSWKRSAASMGLALDLQAAVDLAMSAGRDPELGRLASGFAPLRLRWTGLDLPAPIAVDLAKARAALEALSPEMAVPPRDARIERLGGKVRTVPAAPGRALDVPATLQALQAFARRPEGARLTLRTTPTGAAVNNVEGVAQAERVLFDGPIALSDRNGHSFEVPTDTLKAWFKIEDLRNEAGFMAPAVVVDRDAIQAWVDSLAPQVSSPVQEPRYDLDSATGLLALKAAGRAGLELDRAGSVERVIQAAYAEQGQAELAMIVTATMAREDMASQLNRSVFQVRQMALSFAGSPSERVANILAAVGRVSGSLVLPDQTFSFLGALRDLDPEAGFDPRAFPPARALEAAAGSGEQQWAPDGPVLGGVELVSSLAFRLAFWLGLPILERRAPPWRIGWLEPPVGMDAAVGRGPAGEPRDLRFINDSRQPLVFTFRLDTDRQLLIGTVFGSEAAFRQVDPGDAPRDDRDGSATPDSSLVSEEPLEERGLRVVTLRGPIVRDLVPAARPLALRDERLLLGTSLQVGWAREGATVLVERGVTVGSEPRTPDVFLSSYLPAGNITLAGTGRP
jgi:vancomycin resistance protein YoaR